MQKRTTFIGQCVFYVCVKYLPISLIVLLFKKKEGVGLILLTNAKVS